MVSFTLYPLLCVLDLQVFALQRVQCILFSVMFVES